MILVSFLLVPWFALMKATHSHTLLLVPHLLCVRIEPLFSGCSAAGAQGPHGRRAPRTRQPARAGSAWSGNRAPRDASRYVSSGRGGRRSRGVRGGWEVEEDEKDEVVGERAEDVADAAFVTGGGKILG